jgi:glucose/arabinose dehydrogenase
MEGESVRVVDDGSGLEPERWNPARSRWIAAAAAVAVAVGVALLVVSLRSSDEPPTDPLEALPAATTTTTLRTQTTIARADAFLGGLEIPNDLAFDPTGGLFVSETGAGRVSRVEILLDGSAGESVVVASGIVDAEGLAYSAEGVLYVSGESVVHRVADGVTTTFADGFVDPEGLAIDSNGDLYVADDAEPGIRITKVTVLADGTAGESTEIVIVPGASAADIDFGPTGELFVANSLDAVWVVEFGDGESVTTRLFATIPGGPRALAFDPTGTLYVFGESSGTIWAIAPEHKHGHVFASGLDPGEGLAFDIWGSLYVSIVETNEVVRIEGETPIDVSGTVANPSTTRPDVAGALSGDESAVRLKLGVVDDLPTGPYLDFLYHYGDCDPGCFRDAVFVNPDDRSADPDPAGERFYVRHGFINNSAEPLGEEFDVVMYLTRWSGPDPDDGAFDLGQTYRFTSDYVLRGSSYQCGPTYRTQTEPQTCEWFVHDFPDGIPSGRYDLWAVWEAPCSTWLDLAFTDSCDDPSKVVSLFSSGVNSPFGGNY